MNNKKLKWCLKQNGIQIINKKEHLSISYMQEADKTLENMFITKGNWKIIIAYYACHNALNSIFLKCGIRCKIHSCSIELMELFKFSQEDIKYITKLKQMRIETQYYLKQNKLKDENKVKIFIIKCKKIIEELNQNEVYLIRKELKLINEIK